MARVEDLSDAEIQQLMLQCRSGSFSGAHAPRGHPESPRCGEEDAPQRGWAAFPRGAWERENLQRKANGLPAEKGNKRVARVEDLSDTEIQQLMLQIPFRKFAQRKYLHYARDVSKVRFDKRLWNCFGERDLGRLKEIADLNIQTYFNSK